MTELTIIQGCKNLDQTYQKALVSKYSAGLYTVARRYCGDELAKDALQEGLVRILKNISKFDERKGNFEGWMRRVVVNESLRILQKEKTRFTIDFKDINPKTNEKTPIDSLNEEDLLSIIKTLPLGYREVFNMYVVDGFDHKEIGKLLGISSSTSRSQLSRAKKILQQKISMIENLPVCHKN